jgi:hypothetical protein
MATARFGLGGCGTQTEALTFGGENPGGYTNSTEEFTGAGVAVTKTITVS